MLCKSSTLDACREIYDALLATSRFGTDLLAPMHDRMGGHDVMILTREIPH